MGFGGLSQANSLVTHTKKTLCSKQESNRDELKAHVCKVKHYTNTCFSVATVTLRGSEVSELDCTVTFCWFKTENSGICKLQRSAATTLPGHLF